MQLPATKTSVSKIKLLCLIGQLGRGGSEQQLYLLLTHLDPGRFERHVVVFNPSNHDVYDEALRQHGVHVWPVPATSRTIRRRSRFVYRKLCQLRPDVVHSWTLHDNVYAGLLGRLARVPVRWGSLRGSLLSPGFQQLPAVFRYLSIHGTDKIVVNTAGLTWQLAGHHFPARRVLYLPNCVMTNGTAAQPADLSELGIESHHRLIGLVGNLRRVKNHLMFVEALARLRLHHPDLRGLIVGQPLPQEPELPALIERRIEELGLAGKVVLAGYRRDIPALMRRFDVFCLTSRSEGTPNVILEAMAASCPVVATRVGGIPEVVTDGANGLLVESEDVAGFAQAVERLLKDPQYARTIGTAGRQTVEREFSCDRVAQRLANLYEQALT